jgi:hypothetical protein
MNAETTEEMLEEMTEEMFVMIETLGMFVETITETDDVMIDILEMNGIQGMIDIVIDQEKEEEIMTEIMIVIVDNKLFAFALFPYACQYRPSTTRNQGTHFSLYQST